MTAQETVQKLVLYAKHKQNLREPAEYTASSWLEVKRLKRELLDAGISPELLDFSGDEIAQIIYESLMKRGYT